MKRYLLFSCLIVTISILVSCKSMGLNSIKNKIETVKYGTSFGHCVGVHCNKTFTISKDDVIYTRRANGSTNDSLAIRDVIETEQWDNLTNAIHDSGLKKLTERIGCPDCADGGSEWIEISEEGKTTRVTYEYGKTPDEIKEIVRILKRLTDPLLK